MRWIIVSCNYGRLGNRLHTHANILAWCVSNNYNLSNLSFRTYSNLFEKQSNHSSDSYFESKNILFFLMKFNYICNFIERLILSQKWTRRLSLFFHIIEKDNFSVLYENELNLIKTKKIIIIKAWDIRCPNSIKLSGKFVRNHLRPMPRYVDTANNFINNLKNNYDCLIGIHARRGDYKTYLNGEYYYSWQKYKTWILQLRKLFQSLGYNKVGFILCSDEKPSVIILSDKNTHYDGHNHYMKDLHSLSLCNYNIGPPSSFGTWISWYGKVPRLILKSATNIDSINNFFISEYC